jgi:hypothetical protein
VGRGPDNRLCLVGDAEPSGSCKVFIGEAATGLFTYAGDEVLSFDYWADPATSQVNFNVYDRTQRRTFDASAPKLIVGKWTRVTIRLADFGDAANRMKEGDWIINVYIQGTGVPPRKFYVDNVLIVRPRAIKPRR